MRAAVHALAGAGAALAAWLIQALILLMLAILAYQVFMRSVLDAPPSWTEEVALLGFTWLILLGTAYGVRQGIHVRMDVLLDALPARWRVVLERAIAAAVAIVGGLLALAGWDYVLATSDTTSAAIGYPMPVLYVSTVVSGALIAVFGIERLLGAAPGEPPREGAGP
jgi:TRAP-type C4-dicarboxylate transport system permease small subunit